MSAHPRRKQRKWLFPILMLGWLVVSIIHTEVMVRHYRMLRIDPNVVMSHAMFMLIIALVAISLPYGKISSAHPAYHPKYRKWLEQSPWTSALPLPFGSPLLGWSDGYLLAGAFVLIVLELLYLRVPFFFIWLIATYLVAATGYSYVLGTIVVLGRCGMERKRYLLLALMPLGALLVRHPMALVCVGLIGFVLSDRFIRESLRSFPWPEKPNALPSDSLGKPLRPLAPDPAYALPVIPRGWGLAIAVMIGWWILGLGSLGGDSSAMTPRQLQGWLFAIVFGTAFFRWASYAVRGRAPLSIRGRFYNLTPLLAGYDQIFIAPPLIILAGLVASTIGFYFNFEPHSILALCVAVVFATAFEMNPTMGAWKLTGAISLNIDDVRSRKSQIG